MFRQPKKHAATTSSKGQPAGKAFNEMIINPFIFPEGENDLFFYKNECVAYYEADEDYTYIRVGLVLTLDQFDNELYELIIPDFQIMELFNDKTYTLINQDTINAALNSHIGCSEFAEPIVSIMKKNKGRVIADMLIMSPGKLFEEDKTVVADVCRFDEETGDVVVLSSVDCHCYTHSVQAVDPCMTI